MPTLLLSFSLSINNSFLHLFQSWPWIEKSARGRVCCPRACRPIRHPLLFSPPPRQNTTLSPCASPSPPTQPSSSASSSSFATSKLCIHHPQQSSLQLECRLVMASKLSPNVLYVAEHGESLGSPQADSERTHIVSIACSSASL